MKVLDLWECRAIWTELEDRMGRVPNGEYNSRALPILREMGFRAEEYTIVAEGHNHEILEYKRIRVSIPEEEYTMLLLQSG